MFHSKHEGHLHSVSEFDQCTLYLNFWTTGCLPGCYFVCLFFLIKKILSIHTYILLCFEVRVQ